MVALVTLQENTQYQPDTVAMYSERTAWQWAKVYKEKDDTFTIMQYPVSCKDYVIDMYFRTPNSSLKTTWPEEVLMQPFVAIFLPHAEINKKFLHNVTTLLHPWETKHGLKPLILHPVTTSFDTKHPIEIQWVLEFDPRIMRNATAFSFYLSIIRTLGYNTGTTLNFTDIRGCNEHHYYNQCPCKEILQGILEKPKFLWKKVPEGFNKLGDVTGTIFVQGHGASGIFYMLSNIRSISLWHAGKEELDNTKKKNYLYSILINRIRKLPTKE